MVASQPARRLTEGSASQLTKLSSAITCGLFPLPRRLFPNQNP